MTPYALSKPVLLALLFIKEQLKEPVALFWTVISPVVTYYLIAYTRAPVMGGWRLFVEHFMVLRFCRIKCCVVRAGVLHRGSQRERFSAVFCLYRSHEGYFPCRAVSRVFDCFNPVLLCVLPADTLFVWRGRYSRVSRCRRAVLCVFSAVFHTFAFVNPGPSGLSECEYGFLHVVPWDVGAWNRKYRLLKLNACLGPVF